jgi:hypothetical protein
VIALLPVPSPVLRPSHDRHELDDHDGNRDTTEQPVAVDLKCAENNYIGEGD